MEIRVKDIQFQQRRREYVSADAAGDWRLHYIVGGRGRLTCAAERLAVRSGYLLLLPPGGPYRVVSSRRSSFISQYIVVIDGLPSELLPAGGDGPQQFDIGASGRRFFEQLRLDHASGNPLVREAARYRLLSFLLGAAGRGCVELAGEGRDPIEEALRLMQENVCGRMSLEELAAAVGLNKSYLVRLFRARLGMAPMRYYNELKINAACHLLDDTVMTVAEIAGQLGFSEEFYFSRCFKKFKGVAPAIYRRRPAASALSVASRLSPGIRGAPERQLLPE